MLIIVVHVEVFPCFHIINRVHVERVLIRQKNAEFDNKNNCFMTTDGNEFDDDESAFRIST